MDDVQTEAERRCKKRACEIQTCLKRNNYQQDKCKRELEDYFSCVKKAEKQLAESSLK